MIRYSYLIWPLLVWLAACQPEQPTPLPTPFLTLQAAAIPVEAPTQTTTPARGIHQTTQDDPTRIVQTPPATSIPTVKLSADGKWLVILPEATLGVLAVHLPSSTRQVSIEFKCMWESQSSNNRVFPIVL